MKNLKSILPIVGAVLAVVGVCFMFLPGIVSTITASTIKSSVVTTLSGLLSVFGKGEYTIEAFINGVSQGVTTKSISDGSVNLVALFAYIALGLGALVAVLDGVKKNPIFGFVSAVLFIAAGILLICEPQGFVAANPDQGLDQLGTLSLGVGAILGVVTAFLAAATTAVAA